MTGFVAIAAAVLLLAGCTARGLSPPTSPPGTVAPPATVRTPTVPDAKTAASLLHVASVFNEEFGNNDDGPVYDRWDARSQAVISRAEYLRRHAECPTAPQAAAHVEIATPGPNGAWQVRYAIGGVQFTDYWFYVDHRWVFDLLLSNPHAVQLYRLSGPAYAAAVGCAGS